MKRSLQTLERRRNAADAATGISRVNVALYACLGEDGAVDPQRVLDGLRRYAEARDWTVPHGAAGHDVGPPSVPRSARPVWPRLEALIVDGRVSGLIVPDESHLALGPECRTEWRDWIGPTGVFVVCLPDVMKGSAAA